jgi:hypothetical protein
MCEAGRKEDNDHEAVSTVADYCLHSGGEKVRRCHARYSMRVNARLCTVVGVDWLEY